MSGCSSASSEMKELIQYKKTVENLIAQYENPPREELNKRQVNERNVYYYYYYDLEKKANSAKIEAKTAALGMKTEKAQKAGLAITNVAEALEDVCKTKANLYSFHEMRESFETQFSTNEIIKEMLRLKSEENIALKG